MTSHENNNSSATLKGATKIFPPFNLFKWIDEHRDLLKPPVNAKLIFEESLFIIMIVGGPNERTDYHINQTEEFFFQLQGDMCLKVVEDGEFKDIPIKEGEIFLLPANTPHSPQRFANTVGLVIEQRRRPEHIDRLRWYCLEGCKSIVYEHAFHYDSLDLGSALKPIIMQYRNSIELRTCKKCGKIAN